jgi:hypothetical protein
VTIKSDDVAMGVARFQIVHESDSRYYWQLINPHGTPVSVCGQQVPRGWRL